MSKEQALNYKDMPEEELRALLKKAKDGKDYQLQLNLYWALLPYEERPCLALTAIKELEKLIKNLQTKSEKLTYF
ncbi:MAG: hypothetical protein GX943_03390 [Candidatus Pacebacteria bacterium]|jgi:hypothetical protein|nr:hypothetical protein [Candidatus Paceibacterota bacterium]